MNPLSRAPRRLVARLALVGALFALVFMISSPVSASPETLKRSIENMTLWPFDAALSPVVAGKTVYQNMRDIDDSTAVRVGYAVPGFVWVTFVQSFASVLRGVTGVMEFLPGLGLLPFEADLDPIFDMAEENEALVDLETPVYDVRFGISYTSAGY